MKLKNLLLGTAVAIAASGAAHADYASPTGWYMSLGAGINWIEDGNIDTHSTGGDVTANRISYSDGYIVSGAVGYDFGERWRAEFEVAYRDNDVDSWCTSGRKCEDFLPEVWELSQMVNVLYDMPLGGNWEGTVGAGVGGNLVALKGYGDDHAEFDDYVLAGQLIAQVGYQFSDRWKAYADYHYMFMDDPDLADLNHPYLTRDMEKTDHSLQIGLRFDLQRDGAAPVRHVDTPKGAPKQFIVFFGFNKSNLTPEAQRVVSEAAAAAKETGAASITVVGHTDTVGSNEYNVRLSMRRSQAVKDALISLGVASSGISTSGRGESELMVQTGDSVKEPQNRRATIDLSK